MTADHSISTKTSHRNKTVFVAVWILCVVALLELVLAALFFSPRIFSQLRSSSPVSPSLTPPSTTGTASNSTTPIPASPVRNLNATTLSPVKDIPGGTASDSSFPQNSSLSTAPGEPSLQILSTKLEGSEEGSRKLQIAIKSNPQEQIDVPQEKVQVYFYDEEGGEIVPSKAQVTSKWLNPPADWKNGEPQLLEVRYLPDSADQNVQFAGYILAVYYKGDLQDCRADPPRLKKLFEPKYFIGTDE